jgi:hypothetical protein
MMLFLDESASFNKHDFICVCGYLSGDDGWAEFAKEWRILLKRHGLNSFHTSDFLAGDGEYRPLGLSKERRLEVLKEFITPIRKHVLAGFGVGVDAKYFRKITNQVKKHVRPEVFCFQRIIKIIHLKLQEWEKESGYTEPEPYNLFFDDVEDYAMKVL